MLKVFAVLIVVGGIWVWANGHSMTKDAPPARLSAAVSLAPTAQVDGTFDEEGTIMIDTTQGQGGGTPYILYTDYSEAGKPSVRTKRLVFRNQDQCAESNLPCATNQPGAPVSADEKVRVVGRVQDEFVEVSELYRL